jgi:hypothetical protein
MAEAGATFHDGVRVLNGDDLERVIAIDRAHSGRSRRHFFAKRFAAAAAHPNEFIQIGVMRGGSLRGFATARVFCGEFGREPTIAMLDAIGVEMEVQERGVGHTLVLTEVDWSARELLGFLDRCGFHPSSYLCFDRTIARSGDTVRP